MTNGVTRRPARGERGQALPALALVVAGLVAFTVFVIVPLGSATDRRAEARTAADAAALAALDSVAEDLRGIGTILPPGLGGNPGNGVAILDVLADLEAAGAVAAEDYAARNDARLVDFDMDISLAATRPVVIAYARTESVDAIETTSQKAHAEATARLDVLGGFCGVGNAWGLELDDGTCRKVTDLLDPPEEPSPSPTPTPTGTETASPSPDTDTDAHADPAARPGIVAAGRPRAGRVAERRAAPGQLASRERKSSRARSRSQRTLDPTDVE